MGYSFVYSCCVLGHGPCHHIYYQSGLAYNINHLTDYLSSQRKPLTEELTVQRSFQVTPADLKRAVDPVLYRVIVNLVRCDVIIYLSKYPRK